LELLKKGINQAWADVSSDSLLEFAEYAVAVARALIKKGEYVES